MNSIEIQHKNLETGTLFVDSIVQAAQPGPICTWSSVTLGSVEIQFRPYGITPLLRINGFLINYWLAGVLLQDHAIGFDLYHDFFTRYRTNDFRGRMASLGANPSEITVDRVVGRNLHQDLIDKIEQQLHEKSHPS